MEEIFEGKKVVMINPSLLKPTENISWSECPDSLDEYQPLIIDKDMNIIDGHHRFMFIHRQNRISKSRPWSNISQINEYPCVIK